MKNQPFLARVGCALQGISSALRTEHSLRAHAWIALAVLPVMLLLQPALLWWALVGLVIALIFAAELINTALEHLADLLHPAAHPRIKIVKDCAAGAVLVLCVGAVWIGVLTILSTF